ncbi:cysteine-rich motor neuron 1 protein-like [Ylistrum balloti]|uniref:cysteine-rich motor neuron 1 protein-like n=1 Tax=Ylistrum balloti TaxID=509963 RepID=UPI002905A81D|nr:cysteine-rich motor neuron 1 protein-like [Ylistrum balloti]
MNIRGKTISYAAYKKKLQNIQENELNKSIEALEKEEIIDVAEIDRKKRELEEIRVKKIKGSIVRSRAKWEEEGEKPTSYFFNLENRNFTSKIIPKVQLSNVAEGFFMDGFQGGQFGPGGFHSDSSGCVSLHHYCPISPILCPNGFAKDTHGCLLCHCAESSTATDPAQQTIHHYIHNPCIPTQAHCTLPCDVYLKGGTGCEFCMCDHAHQTKSPTTIEANSTTSQVPTTTLSTTQPPTSAENTTTASRDCALATHICNAQCDGKYLVDPNDCTFCVCKGDLG